MKHTEIIISAVVMLFASFPSYAKETEVDTSYIFDAEEYQEIRKTSQSDPLLSYEELCIDENAAASYTVHYIRSKDFRNALLNGGSIFELISNDYYWCCAADEQTLLYVRDENGDWKLRASVKPSPDMPSGYVDNASVKASVTDIVSKEGKLLRPVVYFISSGDARTTFAYFETSENVYLIPFSSRPDFSGLTNGKVYTAGEAVQYLEENLPLPDQAGSSSDSAGNTVLAGEYDFTDYLYMYSTPDKNPKVFPYVLCGAGVLLAAGIIMFIILKRQGRKP